MRMGVGTMISRRLSWTRSAATLSTLAVIASLSVAISPSSARTPASPGETVGSGAERATITRDAYGVPTVTASSMAGVWFGAGYAQAEDRLAQLELERRAVEGTLSQLGGSSYLSQDEVVRTFFYTPAELSAEEAALPADTRAALAEFSAGINAFEAKAFATRESEKRLVPYEFFILGDLLGTKGPYRPAPWKPTDTVAIGNYLAREFGGGGGSELQNLGFLRYLKAELTRKGDRNAAADAEAIFNDTRWINDPNAPTTVPSTSTPEALSGAGLSGRSRSDVAGTARSLEALAGVSTSAVLAAAAALTRDRETILQTGISLKVLSHGGSNAVVVAPSRSRDHHALLWGAPQEGFGTPSVDGEEYLQGPGYDAGGMDITGEPFILIGRNNKISWTTTSEELVDERIYVEKVRYATNPPTYLWDGHWIAMQEIREEIPVEGKAPREFTVYRTNDGPVFSMDRANASAFSMRFASWGREGGTLTGFSELGGDVNLAQFEHSMSLITTLHNFLYADQKGNIAYFGDGLVPIEPSFAKVDPRLPALGDGTQQWLGYVPFADMPRSINPAQGFLDNWNTKPSASFFYQQNSGDEYWGTIFRSSRITQLLEASTSVDIAYLEGIEHDIGTIDNEDNTRPAAPYFIPYIEAAYRSLVGSHDPIVDPKTHPDLAKAMSTLASWNDATTLGSPAMSIFMNTLEALERDVCENGTFPGEQYVGAIDMSDASLKLGTYGGLGGFCTYNFLYHLLALPTNIVPCGTLCFHGSYFGGHEPQVLVESVNDAIRILSGKGTQLGQDVPGFGTPDIAKWGYVPAQDQNWDDLDPAAVGINPHCGTSASQNRSTYMQAIDMGPTVIGRNVLPPGQSGFISSKGVPSPHMCDQVSLFNTFRYKVMPNA